MLIKSCTNETPSISDEQISAIKASPLYQQFNSINCCVSGNVLNKYNEILMRLTKLRQTDSRFIILKAKFSDTSYERFILNEIAKDPNVISLDNNKNYILYLHTKGAAHGYSDCGNTRWRAHGYSDCGNTRWRAHLHNIVLGQADLCLTMFENYGYDTVSTLLVKNYRCAYPDGHVTTLDIYAGNFFWARASYLKRLFKHHSIGARYYDTEQFLFKDQPYACNL